MEKLEVINNNVYFKMKRLLHSIQHFRFNLLLIHTFIGILIGITLIHPLTMIIYWFEFNPSDISFNLLVDIFITRVKHSFHSSMFLMNVIFASIGGLFGFIFGLYSRALKLREVILKQNEQLTELDNIKSNFLHLISHEIRTPLHGIIGFVSILKNMDTTSEVKHIVDMLDLSATRLENFSLTALRITELRTKERKINCGKINLLEEVRRIVKKYNEKIVLKQVKVVISSGLNVRQTYASVDADLFCTCIELVFANALQFCNETITVNCNEDLTKSFTILEIVDDGRWFSGLPDMDVFGLLGSNTINFVGYNGLDFPLIKLICAAHKGKIEVGRTDDGGDTVKLYLPIYKN